MVLGDIHKTRNDYFYSLQSFLTSKDLNGYKRMLAKAAQDEVYPEYCHAGNGKDNLLNSLLIAIQNDAANLAFLEATLPYCKKIDASCDTLEAFSGLHLLLQKKCSTASETTGLTTDVKIKALELFLRHGADINKQTGTYAFMPFQIQKCELDFGVPPVFIPHEPEVLEALIQNGADLNAVSSEGYTVISGFLYKALLADLPSRLAKPSDLLDLLKERLDTISKSIEVLLKHGAPVNSLLWTKSNVGEELYYSEPPLITLSKLKKEFVGAFKVGGVNYYGSSLLELIDDFCLKICDMLVEHGADINCVDNCGNNVLNVCGSYELFKKFISLGADINHTNEHGETMLNGLLSDSSRRLIYPDEFDQLFHAYIAEGGDVNKASVYNSGSPLFDVGCDEEKILALIKAGADINHRNSVGKTPVEAHVFPGEKEKNKSKSLEERYKTLKLFAELGADLTIQNDAGATLLHRWAWEVSAECEKAGSLKRSKWTTPNDIKKAEERRDLYLDMLEFLVSHGVDVNGNAFRGLTPAAMITANTPRTSTKEIAPYLMKLIDLGADLEICDVNGNSAIDKIKTQKLQNTVRKYMESQKLRNLELDNAEDLFER